MLLILLACIRILQCIKCPGNLDPITNCTTCKNHWKWGNTNCTVCPSNWDPLTDCLECKQNWDPTKDCLECIKNYEIKKNCLKCKPNYNKNCEKCLPNWDIKHDCRTCKNNWIIESGCKQCPSHWNETNDCLNCINSCSGPNCELCTNYTKQKKKISGLEIFLIVITISPLLGIIIITLMISLLLILVYSNTLKVFNKKKKILNFSKLKDRKALKEIVKDEMKDEVEKLKKEVEKEMNQVVEEYKKKDINSDEYDNVDILLEKEYTIGGDKSINKEEKKKLLN